jgi:regulatory protein
LADDDASADEASIREAAVKLLARREHSEYELRAKLNKRDYEDDAVNAVIEALRADNLVSDERFAEAYVQSRVNKGFGPVRIRGELQQRGVSDALAESALNAADCDWDAAAREQLQRRFGSAAPVDRKERQRRYSYLTRRGFTGDQVNQALDSDEPDT